MRTLVLAWLIALAAVGASQAKKLNNLKNVDDDVFFGVHSDLRDRAGASEGSAVEAQAKTAEGAAAAGESARSWAEIAKENISASEGQEKTGAAVGAAKDKTSETANMISLTHGQAKPSVDMAKEELLMPGGTAGASKDLTAQAKVTSCGPAGAAKNNTLESIDRVRGRAESANKRHGAESADKRHVDRAPVAVAGQSSFTLSQLITLIVGGFFTACTIGVAYCIWRQTKRFQVKLAQAAEAGANQRHLEMMGRDFDIELGLAQDPYGSPISTNARTTEMVLFPKIEGFSMEDTVAAETMTDAAHI